MSITFSWTDTVENYTLSILPTKLDRKVVGNQKEVPIRGGYPFYIPLGFTGPEITLTFGVPTSTYANVMNLSTETKLQVVNDDPINIPEFLIDTYWYVTGITVDRGEGQQMSHSCELKLMREWRL